MDNAFKEWLDFAETDLGVARHLYETYRPQPLEIICYHCQQAAEKSIKAVVVAYGVAVRYPSELGLEERHAKTALEHAGELLNWVRFASVRSWVRIPLGPPEEQNPNIVQIRAVFGFAVYPEQKRKARYPRDHGYRALAINGYRRLPG